MSEPARRPEQGAADWEAQYRAAKAGDRILATRAEPWLIDVGSWVFGGLLVFTAAFIAALIEVGQVDGAILVSITAFGCALPFEVAGIAVVRLVRDLKQVGIDDLTLQSYKDAGFPDIEAYTPPAAEREAQRASRLAAALLVALVIALVCTALTAIGLVAALWFIAWWTGVVALVAIALSAALIGWTMSLPAGRSPRRRGS